MQAIALAGARYARDRLHSRLLQGGDRLRSMLLRDQAMAALSPIWYNNRHPEVLPMQAYKLNESITVCGQISEETVARIAELGYRVLVNNRPDGEEAGQPSSAQIQAAAERAGMEYHHMPVNGMTFPGEHLETMAVLFDDAERPVFAFCRTGTRCANLWVASRDPEARQEAFDYARSLGFDLSLAARLL